MVGTKLTIIVSSDANEGWAGRLEIDGTDRDYGAISARDYNDVTRDWEGSHLEAAGTSAKVTYDADSLKTSVGLVSDSTGVPGDWFVVDYTATNVGNCHVGFYEDFLRGSDDRNPFDPSPGPVVLIHELVFSHVPTRDFTGDANVNFADFAVLASFQGVTNCADLNQCEGTDLDADGDVDSDDMMLFADYWLEKTE
ncbi:MAG: hypothetical protein CEE38_15115 [Planctomycetes bacterium B3_Pla]|nr:MAG: hypothetical protein CEE38_15115 [Planctomycetes bacterium B3_Pla]